jgi:alpha-L-arabinofuranosidase
MENEAHEMANSPKADTKMLRSICIRACVLLAAVVVNVGAAEDANMPAAKDARSEAQESNAAPAILIDAAAPRVAVNPNMYGIFFEEINHAGEGGLYAEMVLDRDFEINTLPPGARWAGNLLRTPKGWQERKWFGNALHGWRLITEDGAKGSIRQERIAPLNNRNPHSMRLTVNKVGGRIGVANEGFWGMNFQAGHEYDLSFYARTEGEARFDVTATLEDLCGRVYASAAVADVGGNWKQYRCRLKPERSDPRGRLVIFINRPGTIWFDVVSLFPRQTFKDRPNGLRPDLAQMLADLRPGFVRFPGGAIVGGLMLSNRIQWKNSIGDVAQRQGTMNLWGYYTTNGLGYHEYLQMSEDLGAEALWVCNPGMSDGYRIAEVCAPETLSEYVQEALDALEYALGPGDSKWGALRAANGHPKPFNLKYIEIGNEAGGAQYQQHYKVFYEAIKKRFPAVTIIGNQSRAGETPVEMVDHHKYGDPNSFFRDADRYDHADRKGPRIYVGEYGCNSGVGEGNLMAALAEAAYLIGLERNADVVKMASYAPLFFNVNDIAWPVNMIGFDSSRVVGRSSYHVQKLFSWNRPDEVLQTQVAPAIDPEKREVYALAGLDKKTGDLIIKAVNRAGSPRTLTIKVRGIEKMGSKAKVTVLSHDDAAVENTLDDPDVVVPVESEFSGVRPEFTFTFKPYSLTILRIGS